MSAKVGAPFTISLVMPVRIWMSGGIERSGSTSEDHSSTTSPSTTRTMATSVTRSPVAEVPVVSRSTKATAGASVIKSGGFRDSGIFRAPGSGHPIPQ